MSYSILSHINNPSSSISFMYTDGFDIRCYSLILDTNPRWRGGDGCAVFSQCCSTGHLIGWSGYIFTHIPSHLISARFFSVAIFSANSCCFDCHIHLHSFAYPAPILDSQLGCFFSLILVPWHPIWLLFSSFAFLDSHPVPFSPALTIRCIEQGSWSLVSLFAGRLAWKHNKPSAYPGTRGNQYIPAKS